MNDNDIVALYYSTCSEIVGSREYIISGSPAFRLPVGDMSEKQLMLPLPLSGKTR